ncbi:hypothetical protein HD806DRAFT_548015 [Xylariaceae sp. AK1471]|nr:hypothetical protein HD806DRAFT_548015 [Xylariaceae sp. AK1471]
MKTAVQNVRVFDGQGFTGPQSVIFADGYIMADTEGIETVVDGTGQFLIPGLIDSHVHVPDIDGLASIAFYGVTTALNMACGDYTASNYGGVSQAQQDTIVATAHDNFGRQTMTHASDIAAYKQANGVGLTPLEALRADTAESAKWHQLLDRSEISTGKRADLVLLKSNPLLNISNTRDITRVWVSGVEVQDVVKLS